MNPRDLLRLGFMDLRDKKIRTALTILSIVIGIASIMALVSQTTGIQMSVMNSLQSLGPTSIFVTPKTIQGFSEIDVARLYSVPGVASVTPIITAQAKFTWGGGQTMSFTVIGISSDGFTTMVGKPKLMDGSFYQDTSTPEVVVGYNLVFPASRGTQVIFASQSLTIVLGTSSYTLPVYGLLDTYGTTSFISIDGSMFMPLAAAKRLLNRMSLNMLLVQAVDVNHVKDVSNLLIQIYGNSISVTSTAQLTTTVSNIIRMFSILLGSIAAISLTVASVGILNIMSMSVLERTHVIGILKSIGFRNKDILSLFLSEAIIVGVLGGLAGIAAGFSMSFVIPTILSELLSSGGAIDSSSPSSRGGTVIPFGGNYGMESLTYMPVISQEIILISFSVAVLVSVVASIYPAYRASKMDPIKALRYE